MARQGRFSYYQWVIDLNDNYVILVVYVAFGEIGGGQVKIALKRLIRDEKGKALVLVLINLVVGGLIFAPLLGMMSTGLIAGQVYERKMYEYYAADAGVEDAIWKIQNHVDEVAGLTVCYPDYSYDMTDVNGKSVDVTITFVDNLTYRVVSTATGDGSDTEIEAYITPMSGDFGGILDNVITSQGDYSLQGPTTVNPPEGEEHGPVDYYPGDWPEAEDISDWYWQDVKDETPYNYGSLDVKDYAGGIGPFYRDGTLDILNTGTDGLTLQLNGTVYITGDTQIGQTNKDFTLDLNGNTIFVESATMDGQYALHIGGKCTITGSGCIIAVGDIEFKPNLNNSPDDYVLVMSIEGKTYMQPNGDFYGTLAGGAEVHIQNGDATWTDPSTVEGGLNFPGFNDLKAYDFNIASWDVS